MWELWGKLKLSNRGRRGDGKLQMHSLALGGAEFDVSTFGLA
jgi:hypothetical protein